MNKNIVNSIIEAIINTVINTVDDQQKTKNTDDNTIVEESVDIKETEINLIEPEDDSIFDLISQFNKINIPSIPERPSTPYTIREVANDIKLNKISNIITLAGAGISTSAGIPDFRSESSGLYNNLQKYKLPYAEAIFDIDYFATNPKPFFELAKELFPGQFKPTISHYFVKLLADKKILKRHYTQNIDMLERVAGVPHHKLVEAHGSFFESHCINCSKLHDSKEIKEKIMNEIIPYCMECNGLVKPDIVFFGENLPELFHESIPKDFPECDLLIVMGTSLTVHPFASLILETEHSVPRVLINMETRGTHKEIPGGFKFDSNGSRKDVAMLGPCDEMCLQLADLIGWKDELLELVNNGRKEFDLKDE